MEWGVGARGVSGDALNFPPAVLTCASVSLCREQWLRWELANRVIGSTVNSSSSLLSIHSFLLHTFHTNKPKLAKNWLTFDQKMLRIDGPGQ